MATISKALPGLPGSIARVCVGVLSLFVAWVLGGYLGVTMWHESALVGGREPLAGKVGSSVAILFAALIIRRYLLRSFGSALVCLLATELAVLLIVVHFSGLTSLRLADVQFNIWWLYALTWNVVLTFLVGTAVGQFWEASVRNRSQRR